MVVGFCGGSFMCGNVELFVLSFNDECNPKTPSVKIILVHFLYFVLSLLLSDQIEAKPGICSNSEVCPPSQRSNSGGGGGQTEGLGYCL